jgi:methylenetetrahydrofolate dehydrogenase (NADP+)/methenyltetrahydrofolate cyclohydrolase
VHNNILMDGKVLSAALRTDLTAKVAALKAKRGITAGLAVVLVGDDPASHVYVRNKGKQCVAVGMNSFEHILPANITQSDLLSLVHRLNVDSAVDGILVQLPLPAHLDAQEVINTIDPAKDVDGFHPVNVGKLSVGLSGFVPCTPLGCLKLLQHYVPQDLSGKHAVVIGRSNIVGKPVAALLLAQNCTVTIAHSKTKDLAALCRTADILVAAIGKPHFVKADWVKDGAIVLDVGINRLDNGTLVGDVDYAAVAPKTTAITPVPGGVGPMTIACLLENTYQAALVR